MSKSLKRLKLSSILATLLLASTTVEATWQQNFLVGVSFGNAERKGDILISRITPPPNVQVVDAAKAYRDNGYFWGLVGGWQTYCNYWLFGAELNADWHYYEENRNFAYTQNNTGIALAARYERNFILGLSGRAGYQIVDFLMPYIRLGIETSRDKMYTAFSIADSFFTAEDYLRTYRFFGGIGAETPLSFLTGLSVRAELNYHAKAKAVRVMGLQADGTLALAEHAPRMVSGKLSLIYNFV